MNTELIKQQKILNNLSGELVKQVEAFATDEDVKRVLSSASPGRTQFRNLIDVTIQATHPEEVIAYIRYKIGKDKNNNWGKPVKNSTLGDLLIGQLNEVNKKAASDNPQTILKAYGKFMGYLYWQQTYLNQASYRNNEMNRGRGDRR